VIGRNPVTLQLRYLQTLREIGANQNSTVVFPMPIDLVKPMLQALGQGNAGSAESRPSEAAQDTNGALEPGAEHPGLNPAPAEPPAADRLGSSSAREEPESAPRRKTP
jgi:hypothetical protein